MPTQQNPDGENQVQPVVLSELLSVRPRPSNSELCKRSEEIFNDLLRKLCSGKTFELTTGSCGPDRTTAKVDLVVVIDTSPSMSDEANALNAAATAAVAAAQKSCPSDLRVSWFGIEGTWLGTNFNKSYRTHLNSIGVSNPSLVGTPGDKEDGAAAVTDLSKHFDWRPGAAKLIFLLGDEGLEGGDPQDSADVIAVNNAIAAASPTVKVFTYAGTGAGATTISEYARLATSTGGQIFSAPLNSAGFQAVLEKIICQGTAVCRIVPEPEIVPCLRLRWGDGKNDHLETDDTEVLCVTVCNPYSNVVLKNFMLHLFVVTAGGASVPNQPNGTPSVQIKPNFMICFDDIPPCDPSKPDKPSCVSREVVMINRGALEGKYKILAAYCFDACFTKFAVESAFEVELVSS